MEKKHAGHISLKQKERLIEAIGEDDELRKARFTNRFTKIDMRSRWDSIAKDLNCIPGAQKTGEQWKRTWKDLKMNAKKKYTQTKIYRMGTGGGPPSENPFSPIDEGVLKILEPTLLEGDQNVAESSCVIHFTSSILKTEPCSAAQRSQPINTENKNNILDDIQENSENINPIETMTPVLPVANLSTPINNNSIAEAKRRVVSRKRKIENHEKNTEKLIYLSEKKIEIEKAYYDKKIEILKDNSLQLTRIADSLVKLNDIIAERVAELI